MRWEGDDGDSVALCLDPVQCFDRKTVSFDYKTLAMLGELGYSYDTQFCEI